MISDGPILTSVGRYVYDVCRDRHIFEPAGQYSSFVWRDITSNLLILTAVFTENKHIDVDNFDLRRFYFGWNNWFSTFSFNISLSVVLIFRLIIFFFILLIIMHKMITFVDIRMMETYLFSGYNELSSHRIYSF